MKILVACDLPADALEQLRALAAELTYAPELSSAALREAVRDAGLLIVGATRVSPETIANARSLQMIVHAGSGPGDIAIDEASTSGIFVTHCPGRHAAAMAELAMGLLIALDRKIVENTIALREGRWNRAELSEARGLAGRTLGILGYGTVGQLLARRARAFDMHVVAWSPRLTPDAAVDNGVELCNWPRELARLSDFVTVHAVGPANEVLVDAQFVRNMRPGAGLIHLGHPGAIDEAALALGVEELNLRIASDVHSSEPSSDTGRIRCRLCELPGVIGTQHIGGLTEQARMAIAAEVVHLVQAFVVSGEVHHCLNLAERSPATWQLVIRVRDQVGVMASILAAVRADGINAQEITSRVFTGAKAAWCNIALDERPSTEALEHIRSLPDVLHLELRAVV